MKELDPKQAPDVTGGILPPGDLTPVRIDDPYIVLGPEPTVPPYVPTKNSEY